MLQRCLKAKAKALAETRFLNCPLPRGFSVPSSLPGILSFGGGGGSFPQSPGISGYPLLRWTKEERNQRVNSEGRPTAFPVLGKHFGEAFGRQNSGARSLCRSHLTLCTLGWPPLTSSGGGLQGSSSRLHFGRTVKFSETTCACSVGFHNPWKGHNDQKARSRNANTNGDSHLKINGP